IERAGLDAAVVDQSDRAAGGEGAQRGDLDVAAREVEVATDRQEVAGPAVGDVEAEPGVAAGVEVAGDRERAGDAGAGAHRERGGGLEIDAANERARAGDALGGGVYAAH